MDDKFSINVKIGERFYPLRIDRTDEERIRMAAKLINEKVTLYKDRYADKDIQDCLTMASLQFVIKMLELEGRQDVSPVVAAVAELNDRLEQLLSEETAK